MRVSIQLVIGALLSVALHPVLGVGPPSIWTFQGTELTQVADKYVVLTAFLGNHTTDDPTYEEGSMCERIKTLSLEDALCFLRQELAVYLKDKEIGPSTKIYQYEEITAYERHINFPLVYAISRGRDNIVRCLMDVLWKYIKLGHSTRNIPLELHELFLEKNVYREDDPVMVFIPLREIYMMAIQNLVMAAAYASQVGFIQWVVRKSRENAIDWGESEIRYYVVAIAEILGDQTLTRSLVLDPKFDQIEETYACAKFYTLTNAVNVLEKYRPEISTVPTDMFDMIPCSEERLPILTKRTKWLRRAKKAKLGFKAVFLPGVSDDLSLRLLENNIHGELRRGRPTME
ncbi:hypothetical protein IWQ62_001555 [Dispira parvispora]|uniref:Uncharacterized protein n=1 Tax=Dispira parvispora TaxID=1520584 RepID=A0A9W8AS42_9FUNG|nr:hypothetical protein IWQ62_001555 [Dispira parvispora]